MAPAAKWTRTLLLVVLFTALVISVTTTTASRGKMYGNIKHDGIAINLISKISDTVAVISLKQACGSNSSIYQYEGSNAIICAEITYIIGSSTLPRSVDVALVTSDGTAQCKLSAIACCMVYLLYGVHVYTCSMYTGKSVFLGVL